MDHFSKLRTTSVQLTFAKKKKKKQFYGKHTFPFLMMLLMVFWPLCVCVCYVTSDVTWGLKRFLWTRKKKKKQWQREADILLTYAFGAVFVMHYTTRNKALER